MFAFLNLSKTITKDLVCQTLDFQKNCTSDVTRNYRNSKQYHNLETPSFVFSNQNSFTK